MLAIREPRIVPCRQVFYQSVLFGRLRLSRPALFLLAAAMLNRLTLMLAPVALASVLLYSFSKRWTLLVSFVAWLVSFDCAHRRLDSRARRAG